MKDRWSPTDAQLAKIKMWIADFDKEISDIIDIVTCEEMLYKLAKTYEKILNERVGRDRFKVTMLLIQFDTETGEVKVKV